MVYANNPCATKRIMFSRHQHAKMRSNWACTHLHHTKKTMTTSVKITLAALIAAALGSIASAQMTPPFPSGVNTFADPGIPNNIQYAADLGDMYFDSDATVPSTIQTWSNGPVNLTTVFGANPFKAEGGTVKTIFLGETAGWKNDYGFKASNAPGTYTPLVTDVENSLVAPFGNIRSGWETNVNYAAGATLDFWLNSGGDVGQGGLFYAFGSPNEFSGSDTSNHTRWSVRDVTTTYFNGVTTVTEDVKTLLVGFEDVRQGISFNDGDFNDFVVAFQFLPSQMPPVPEPSTYGLLGGAALVGLIAVRRFKKKTA